MNSYQVATMNSLPNSDEVGITRELTNGQIDELATQVGRVVNALPFVIGDLYNQKCQVLGIKQGTRTDITSLSGERGSDPLDDLCVRMGVERRTAETYAVLARKFVRGDRCAGLTMAHYKQVVGMDRPQAVALLKSAQMGDQLEDGSWIKPWTTRRLLEERVKLEGRSMPPSHRSMKMKKAAAEPLLQNVMGAVLPDLTATLTEAGVKASQQKKCTKAVTKTVEGVVVELRAQFDDEVRRKAKEAAPEIIKEAEAAKRRAADTIEEFNAKQERLKMLSEGVAKPLTLDEFKLLRSFCHEDKFQHDPVLLRKAREASIIINRLGSKLGYIK